MNKFSLTSTVLAGILASACSNQAPRPIDATNVPPVPCKPTEHVIVSVSEGVSLRLELPRDCGASRAMRHAWEVRRISGTLLPPKDMKEKPFDLEITWGPPESQKVVVYSGGKLTRITPKVTREILSAVGFVILGEFTKEMN